MKTIHRYLFTELIKVFSISVVFLTTIFLLEQMLYMSSMIANRGMTFLEGLQLMAFTCPVFLTISLPFSVLVASVTMFNQICGDNEYVAMKTSGWSFFFLIKPVLLFSFLVYILTNFVVFYATPWGTESFKKTIFNIIQQRAHIDIKPKTFNKDFQNLVLYANDKKGNNILLDVFVSDEPEKGDSTIILAKQGIIISDPGTFKIKLQFQDGTMHDVTKNGKSYNILKFDRYERYLEIPDVQRLLKKLVVRHKDISYSALKKKIQDNKAKGINTDHNEVRLAKKFSIPFACLIFGVLGATLGIKSNRSGKSGGMIISIFVIALYYITIILAQQLGGKGLLSPTFAMWIPNIWLFALAFYLAWKTIHETPFTIFSKVQDICVSGYEFAINVYKNFSTEKTRPALTPRLPSHSENKKKS
jgi:lipopolysaccharide export system permease protein